MENTKALVHHILRLLKHTSLEIRRATSNKLPEPVGTSCPPSSYEFSSFFDDQFSDWYVDPSQTEFSLSDELIKGMESIVTYRLHTFETLAQIPFEDARQDQKNDILSRVQEVETRAIVFLALPPTNAGGWEDTEMTDRVNSIFLRFMEDAKACLADACVLLKGEVAQSKTESLHFIPSPPKSDLPKDLLIPGFCQSDALVINQKTNDSLFHLLSDPDLRVPTSLVKLIIGSACSQITGSDPQHCLNRLNYLLALLEGEPVRPPGAAAEVFRLPTNMGTAFAWHCLLNAALAQAERQFAFSLPNVLPFSAVLSTILAKYPEYVPSFLARMASACPILTSYVDDAATIFTPLDAELDDSVLLSWRGISRLFAAVLLARPLPGFTQRPELLNPKLLWITIAGIADHADKLDVTAEVLHGLLEVGGYMLLGLYRRHARRLVKSLISTIGDSQSTPQLALLACLEQLLDPATVGENGYGVLLDEFWN